MKPVLYSFRRCPYAMRARLAILTSGVEVELREILLKDKPNAFLSASPSATVPCLVSQEKVIDESLDIMKWALSQNDPGGWLNMPDTGWDWISRCDGPFKSSLDRTKYDTRYLDSDPREQRALASEFLYELNHQLSGWIFTKPTIADYAILPFVRQFAFIDKKWFDDQPWPNLYKWLDNFLHSRSFKETMHKIPPWRENDAALIFPFPQQTSTPSERLAT